jgi:hypothetical protein
LVVVAQYLCSLKYALNLLMLIEFSHCGKSSGDPAAANAVCEGLLSQNEVHKHDTYIYVLILIALIVVFRILAAIVIKEKAKNFY